MTSHPYPLEITAMTMVSERSEMLVAFVLHVIPRIALLECVLALHRHFWRWKWQYYCPWWRPHGLCPCEFGRNQLDTIAIYTNSLIRYLVVVTLMNLRNRNVDKEAILDWFVVWIQESTTIVTVFCEWWWSLLLLLMLTHWWFPVAECPSVRQSSFSSYG